MLRSNKEREKAVQAAAKMPDRGLAWLTDALKSADPAVRSGAAYAVGRNKLGAAAGPLLRLLDDPSRGVPDEAGRAFTALKGEPGAVASLKEAIKDARTRERAVLMLGQMGDGSAAEVLASLLGDADWRLRRLATQSLAELKATGALQKALQDRYWYVRVCAAECLGRVGSLEAVPGLIAALSDEHWYVRSSAHASLAKLTGQQLPPDPTQWQAWWGREGKKAAGLAR
jgi:HEAT repeat protein